MPPTELTWKDAIARVLEDKSEPMNYLAITEAILEQGLRGTTGATPTYTVAANLAEDLKLPEPQRRFVRVSRGIYGLRTWQREVDPGPIATTTKVVTIEPGVQAYGMYWERSLVDWSKSSVALYGQQFQKAARVDFAEQRGLYLLFDHRSIVYVGRATQLGLGSRLRDHTVDRLRSRWDRFAWFGFSGVRDDGTLVQQGDTPFSLEGLISQLEGVFIEAIEPTQNRQMGKGFVGIEYLQVEDPSFREQRANALKSLVDRL